MSQDRINNLEGAQDSAATGRLDTMYLILDLVHHKTFIYNEWIRFSLIDTNSITIDGVTDSLVLESEPNLMAKLVGLYVIEDSLDDAQEWLDSIPLYDDELRQFYELAQMRIDLAEDSGKTFLDVDSNQIDDLWDIAGTQTRAAIQAQNALMLVEDTSFIELIEEIDTSGGSSKREDLDERKEVEQEDEFEDEAVIGKLYPNPTDDGFILEYFLPEEIETAYLEIYDLMGNLFLSTELKTGSSQINVKTQNLPSKVYVCTVRTYNETLSTQKLVIIR